MLSIAALGENDQLSAGKLLLKAHELMAERLEELAALEALNGGKIFRLSAL